MKDAPARISMIMQVMRVAPITLAQNDSHVSVRWYQAIRSEPSTPQAAHSVAVAQPSKRERNTSRINRSVGMSFADSLNFFRKDIGGSAGGVLCAFNNDQPAM